MTAPPGMTEARWKMLLERCRTLDARMNIGAGKPRLTSGNSHEHGFDRGKVTANETGPGAVDAAPRPLATGPEQEDR